VTKKDLAKRIADELKVNQLEALEIVQRTFDGITETLVTEGRIELRNFGVFEVKERHERSARNPRTGEKVLVPRRFVVTFKPGREMEERVGALKQAPPKASVKKSASGARGAQSVGSGQVPT
jgi:nucleoid DNA-binding protein